MMKWRKIRTQCYNNEDKTTYVRLMYTIVAIGRFHWNPSHELGTKWRAVEVWELPQLGTRLTCLRYLLRITGVSNRVV
jgi:hypothetical protein